jgi:hypothetical protein
MRIEYTRMTIHLPPKIVVLLTAPITILYASDFSLLSSKLPIKLVAMINDLHGQFCDRCGSAVAEGRDASIGDLLR